MGRVWGNTHIYGDDGSKTSGRLGVVGFERCS